MLYNESMVCSRVKEWRESCGYPQEKVARCIGTTRQTLSEFEQGNPDKLRLGQLLVLCRPNVELDGETIPMMDCELGYLLGEEGYENRTRTKTDICKATGLSEVAVSALENLKDFKNTPLGFKVVGGDISPEQGQILVDTIASMERERQFMVLAVIERLLVSAKTYAISSKLQSAIYSMEVCTNPKSHYNYSFYAPEHYAKIQRDVENNGMYIMNSRDAAEYYINEASLAFKELLKEMLPKDKE